MVRNISVYYGIDIVKGEVEVLVGLEEAVNFFLGGTGVV